MNDNKKRIRYYLAGFPGSAHDNRILQNTKIAKNPNKYFSPLEYMIGDSGMEADWWMIPAYKKPHKHELPRPKEIFNTELSKPRVLTEHCIGMWKGRFPWLRNIRMKITENTQSS